MASKVKTAFTDVCSETSRRLTMAPKEVERLEAETQEDFIDRCIGQAGVSPNNRTDA